MISQMKKLGSLGHTRLIEFSPLPWPPHDILRPSLEILPLKLIDTGDLWKASITGIYKKKLQGSSAAEVHAR